MRTEPRLWNPRSALAPRDRALLGALGDVDLERVNAHVEHTFPPHARFEVPAPRRVLRTMFETDRIPADWVEPCNRADEVWVPTEHNLEAFASAGVERERLAIVPEPFELDRLHRDAPRWRFPACTAPCSSPRSTSACARAGTCCIDAWCAAFAPHDDVTLVLKVWSTTRGLDAAAIHSAVVSRIVAAGLDPARVPDIVIVDDLLGPEAMASLYAACDVVVAPTRGEGWGRPLMEAMAMGRPVIATAWSGPAAFVDGTVGWPLDFRLVPVPPEALAEVPAYAGHLWAEPDAGDLAHALRDAHERPAARRERGAAARERAEAFDHRRVAALALARLAAVVAA